METDTGMFCKRCYANLNQATHGRCVRCGRAYDPEKPNSFLCKPFPSRTKMVVHTIITVVLGSLVAFLVAFALSILQMRYIHTGH